MGMFDWVDFECNCPKCGKKVIGFQTKDYDNELETYTIFEVDYFYSSCENCRAWIHYKRKKIEQYPTEISKFNLYVNNDLVEGDE